MPGVLVLPLASGVHSEEAWRPVLKAYLSLVEGYGAEVGGVAKRPEELPDLSGYTAVILLHLTGGTSKIAKRAYELRRGKPLLLVAHGFQNSLPSAVSANAYIRGRGGLSRILYSHRPEVCPLQLELAAAQAADRLVTRGFLVVGGAGPEWELLEKSVGVRVVRASWDEVEAEPGEEARRVAELAGGDERIAKIYAGLKALARRHGVRGLAVDCFPFISKHGYTPCIPLAVLCGEGLPAACEADPYSLLLMSMLWESAGVYGWMANLTAAEGGRVVFTHCTAALPLLASPEAVPHFETGCPYAIQGVLKLGDVCVARLSSDFRELRVYRGTVEDARPLGGRRCRVQARVRLSISPARFFEEALGNHHVLFPSKALPALKRTAFYLGIKTTVVGP